MSVKSFSGFSPILGKEVWVDPSAVLYGEIKLGDDVSIWPMVAARGDVNHIQIGARSNVQDGSVLHVTRKTENPPYGYPLIIGEDVTIGHKAMLHGCTIGNRVLVGMGAIVLDGVVVENDVMIGAGSLIPPHKRLESGYLYMGSPAKQARPLNEKEKAFLSESADNYVRLKQKYLEEQA
ncbi:gamma carbonic anhydrase family protein [Agarivorans sp. B2Z047]|uniref:gamma carbonic anhydrase family protein n=1 Tax=Agarivorans sp. B2Z047 TaxID=2652721 RepID=UPI00128CD252|nr:gamma carbonic anhydrase family protein [Agarivorans sp. B2Z047]MPW31385.1 gamma carbonic anhydrase family protein [Agarivorans sp. B2Z047]UQN42653.1 gamma carbonic anhydrase family protein [Agarivorans sp. B2Z047]